VIHTAAAAKNGKPIDVSAASMREYHTKPVSQGGKGWADIGYHDVVRMDGRREEGRLISRMGAHVEGFNDRSVGICFSGHGDFSPFTPEQMKTGVEICVEYLHYFGLVDEFMRNPKRIIGHREINDLRKAGVTTAPATSKSCPGSKVDMAKFRQAVIKAL
jgi:N-acetylmuramoyl-L-alanine amidase